MTNSYQLLKYIILLTVSLGQVFGQYTSELCNNQTTALGEAGNYSGFLENFDFLTAGCKIGVSNGVQAVCDISDDTFQFCMDAGGQHHLMTLKYICSDLALEITNFELCVGAVCEIDNVIDQALVNITEDIGSVVGELSQSDPADCVIEFYPTRSSPANSTQPGPSIGDNGDESGSHGNDSSLIFYVLMAVLPILILL